MDLSIKPLPTSKSKITQPELSQKGIIPRLGASCIFSGASGSGKSTLLARLLTDVRFFGDPKKKRKKWFQHRFLISPTGEGDDVQKQYGIKPSNVITDLKKAPAILEAIFKSQKDKIKKLGNDRAPQIAIVFDDCVADQKFMREPIFVKAFIASRHYNVTTFLCTQSWTAAPRRCRLQASNIFVWRGSQSEVNLLCTEYSPPSYSKKDFAKLVDFATEDPYSFLHINKAVSIPLRFRKNLGQIIRLSGYEKTYNVNNKQPDVGQDVTNSSGIKQHIGDQQHNEEGRQPADEKRSDKHNDDKTRETTSSYHF